MATVTMYVKQSCPFCQLAKRLLESKGQTWKEIDIESDPARRTEMIERSGRITVPQIFVSDRHIGGYDDLAALEDRGELDRLF